MNHKHRGKTSSFLFTNMSDSERRFGILENGNIYSKNAQPSRDIFQRRMAKLQYGNLTLDKKQLMTNKA